MDGNFNFDCCSILKIVDSGMSVHGNTTGILGFVLRVFLIIGNNGVYCGFG
jgi:hypothetical protein